MANAEAYNFDPARDNRALYQLHDVTPPENGGVFLPTYDNEVSHSVSIREETTPYGAIQKEHVHMDNGTIYPVVTGVPRNSKSDTAIAFTTAWLTSTEGHNMRTFLHMMNLGYPVMMVGPEGQVANQKLSVSERFTHAARVSQTETAYDLNRIADDKLEELDVRPDKIIAIGESRGAMTGYGFGAKQYSDGRDLAYGDYTAPCFPRRASISELPQIAAQLAPELLTLGRLGVELFGKQLYHYRSTVHKDPEYYAKEILKIPMLLSGQAGDLARAIPKDTPIHNRIFVGDGWSQADEWDKLFEDYPRVHNERTHGYHLDIARKDTLTNIEERLRLLQESRGYDGEFDKVNFDPIISLHKHVKKTRDHGNNLTNYKAA